MKILLPVALLAVSVSAWAQPSRPVVRMWHELVYDDERQAVLLVNGSSSGGTSDSGTVELWEWTGEDWKPISGDGPPWRGFASAAFDAHRNVLVVYGGLQEGGVQFDETWEWDGTEWTRRDVPGPGFREAPGMTFDPVRGVVVLFGGAQNGAMMGDTWTWDGREWKNAGITGPQPRFPAALSYDGTRREVVLFGGHAIDENGFRTFCDTWTWNGSRWQELDRTGPSARDGARSAFDTETGKTLVFDGFQLGSSVQYPIDTRIWNGNAWCTRPSGTGTPCDDL